MNLSYKYYENENVKIIKSDEFNCYFNKKNGDCITYGKTVEDDVDFCPFGNMILDMEITTICQGVGGKLCEACYKSNTPNGINMSFETFKTIFDKFPNTLQQIAFGVDSKAESNPDLWKMFEYCREKEIVPNLTVADISDEVADKIAKYAGACAISRYDNKNICYDSVKKLTDRGMTQVNIHHCIHQDSFNDALETIDDMKTDERLKNMNAIVFLSLKNKGRGKKLDRLTQEQFNILMKKCINNDIRFGFDSCSGIKFAEYCKENNSEHLMQYATFCESTLQSFYVNVEGIGFPCSFTEGENIWKDGIDMAKINNFVKDVWYNEKIINFRNKLTKNCGNCPTFKI